MQLQDPLHNNERDASIHEGSDVDQFNAFSLCVADADDHLHWSDLQTQPM